MKRSEAFPSKYMSKDDVNPPVVVTIAHVQIDSLKSDDGEERKPVLNFVGEHKPLILNNTNWMSIEDLYGDESENWRGKMIELYLDPAVMMSGKRVGGIRIRKPQAMQVPTQPDPRAEWVTFCNSNGITESDIRQALGMSKVSEWIAAEVGRTMEQAKALVLSVKSDF